MFDARIRPYIDPPLNAAGRFLAARGVSADQVTWAGFALGMLGCLAVAVSAYGAAFWLVLLGRLADGLDGAVARATQKTDRGGFLDIVLDFILYGALPTAFAFSDPDANALAAVVLLFAYYANGASFLAYAALAAKRGEQTTVQGEKSVYYLSGLAEGAETIVVMLLWCLWPAAFAPLAWTFAALVAVSAAARITLALKTLS